MRVFPLTRFLLGAVMVVLLSAAAAGGWWWREHRAPARYVTRPVTLGIIQRSVTMTGTVDPVNTVQVGSYVSGIVKEVRCDFNTVVTVGQLCARIDPQPFRLVVEQDRADLNTGEAQLRKDQSALTYARLSFERDSKLLADGVVSVDAVDSDRNVLAQAEAQIAFDQASLVEKKAILRAAEVNLGFTDIVSPVDGMVITRNVDVGQTVVSNLQSSTLFLIARDLTRMQVDTNVAEADIAAVKPGQHASFTVQAFPDRVFEASVRQIRQAPITVQSVVTYDVVLAVDNPQRLLLPGMTADTHIITAQSDQVMRVPLAALRFTPSGSLRHRPDGARPDGERHHGGGTRVWVLREQTPTPVAVKIGLDDGSLVEVSGEGLHPGDRVVLAYEGDDDSRRTAAAQQPQRRPPGLRF
jgi:HlyD family secretion protein